MIFKQVKCISDNFSYIIADDAGKAIIIDPSFNSKAIIRFVRNNKLKVNYIIATHHHIDHIADYKKIKSSFNTKIIAHKLSTIDIDIVVDDGDKIKVGNITVNVIHTPGHSPDSICLLINKKIFTGDTLFVGECGRTDLQDSSAEDMYYSLFEKLMKLDDDVEVFPGHDYGSRPKSTIGFEKKTNYTLKKRTLKDFLEFMNEP